MKKECWLGCFMRLIFCCIVSGTNTMDGHIAVHSGSMILVKKYVQIAYMNNVLYIIKL
jgi:hypothetical protein